MSEVNIKMEQEKTFRRMSYFFGLLIATVILAAGLMCYRADVASVHACLTVDDDARRSACIIGVGR